MTFLTLFRPRSRRAPQMPPITDRRRILQTQINEAQARCDCKRVGALKKQMRVAVKDELRALMEARKEERKCHIPNGN